MTIRDEDRDEAEQLKLASLGDRRLVLEGIQAIADNPRVPEDDRREAKRRVAALAELLRMKGPPKKR